MADLSAAGRRSALAELAQQPVDVLVIGGGITGAGIALDAVARGYRVALVERGDFASGTSSRSTKLVHGGIRYLPELDFPLVREALVERGRLLRNAPHLVHPLSFVLPLYASSRHPVGLPMAPPFGVGLGFILDTGLFLYDRLAGHENVGPHRRIAPAEVTEHAKCLIPDGIKTGFVYYDAQTDDSRLTLAVLRSAADHGALLANYCQASEITHYKGRAAGARVRDTLGCKAEGAGGEFEIHARHVVNAGGVWAEELERLAGDAPRLRIVPSKGTHLVFARETFDLGDEAIVLPETADGRIIFIVPWGSRALVGTTDEPVQRLDDPTATDDEVKYLLAHLNRYMRRPVGQGDIIATYAGYRPLLELRKRRTPSRLSRTHALVEGEDGLLTISGGKLTTYRAMAEQVVDRIDARGRRPKAHPTRRMRLAGAAGLAEARMEIARRGQGAGLAPEVVTHLLDAYGADAARVVELVEGAPSLSTRLVSDLPYMRAEVAYACRAELALTVEDVLARRTHIAIEDRTHGMVAVEDIAALMAEELGWPDDERIRQIEAYARYVRHQAQALTAETASSPSGHAGARW
jgi:glycerol-3-phosphate dehydrogenase